MIVVVAIATGALALGAGTGFALGRRSRPKHGRDPRAKRGARRGPNAGTASTDARFVPTDLAQPKRLLRLSGDEFERAAAEAFRRAGYAVEETGGTGDGGVDLIVTRATRRAVVQVKHRPSGRSVDVHGLRELHGVREDKRTEDAIFVSSSGFTSEARHYAKRHGIWLITLNGLKELARGGRAARPAHFDE